MLPYAFTRTVGALRVACARVGAPVVASAARLLDAFSAPALPQLGGGAPALALDAAGALDGATTSSARRSAAGVDDLEGAVDGDEEDTIHRRLGAGLTERSTGLPTLPGFRRLAHDAGDAGSLRWGARSDDDDGDGAGGAPLGRRLALSVEGLAELLRQGIWLAVPKRKASYRVKRIRQMSPLYQETDKQNFYPCPKCDKGLLKLRHHLCPCDAEKVNAKAVVKLRY